MVLICCAFCINTLRLPHLKAVSFLGPAGRRSFFTETWKIETWQLVRTSALKAMSHLMSHAKRIEARFLTSFT